MKILFSYFVFLSGLNLLGQPRILYNPVDTNHNFKLVIDVGLINDSLKVYSGIRSLDSELDEYGHYYFVLHPYWFDKTSSNYQVNSFKNGIDSNDFDLTLSVDKISDLEINL